ncbi:MAG: TrkA C-terminal domain-containing protein, partial [Candidatus Woesearchaeota archaeon]|nr:TrkA C-terminal domain-containing protein [Candidatus Woesearchaeota archaeon]
VLRSLKIDNPHTNIIFSFKSDAETILGINMVRHITDKARVLVKVNTNKFIDIAKKAGANEVIASSEIGGKLLSLSLISPNVVEWFMDSITTRNKLLELEELLITSTSPLKNKSILDADKYFGNAVNILSVSKKGTFDLTTDDSYILKPNDKLIVLIHKDRVKKDKRLNQLFNIK